MSKAYEMISESLNELIKDLEENDGKNLKREVVSIEVTEQKKPQQNYRRVSNEKFFEVTANY